MAKMVTTERPGYNRNTYLDLLYIFIWPYMSPPGRVD